MSSEPSSSHHAVVNHGSGHQPTVSLKQGAGQGETWRAVSEAVQLFAAAWSTAEQPPEIQRFVPAGPPALRRFILAELVKIDLARRWSTPEWRRNVERYLEAFPEMMSGDRAPLDVIYEEWHVRRAAGDEVSASDYLERFPRQAAELNRLLIGDAPHTTTVINAPARLGELKAGESIDDFDLLTRLGQGAFASVFLARQRSMQRLVALKVSADRGDEPRTMAQLDHPHIVRVFDQRLLPERNLRLLYMQYVSGGTLEAVVSEVRACPAAARSGRLLFQAIDRNLAGRGESPPHESSLRRRLGGAPWGQVVCWLGARLASALDYAHEQGVLHRDLKPANVLTTAEGSPKLADFNISYCSKVDGMTPAAYFGGSLSYMSPEQLEAFNPEHWRTADDIDRRSDVYALGVLLWELVSGSRPFDDGPMEDGWRGALARLTDARRRGVAAEAVAALPDDLPTGLKEILLRCLAPDPAERFATARELARQLEFCLQPGVQRLLRPRTDEWRSVARRYPATSLLAGGVVPNVVASGLSIAYNWFAIVEPLGDAGRRIFLDEVLAINSLAYSLAAAVLLWLAWPVVRGVRSSVANPLKNRGDLALARRRCVWLADWVAWVTAGCWSVSGVVFPAWMSLSAATAGRLQAAEYIEFFTALVICGLMAATMSFFLIALINVRTFYPLLIDSAVEHTSEAEALLALVRRTGIYFVLSVSVPFLAVLAVVMLLRTADDRIAVSALGAIGLAAFALAYRFSRDIQRDAAALAVVADPSAEALSLGSQWADTSRSR